MSLQEILNHRRAVRHFDPAQPIDNAVVKKCIEQATLAPTSSNMQLWEAYHVTDKKVSVSRGNISVSLTFMPFMLGVSANMPLSIRFFFVPAYTTFARASVISFG